MHLNLWTRLQFIAEECQTYPDEDSFWDAFTDENGSRLSYQRISWPDVVCQ
jgi:hypothetical protein